MKIKAWHSGVFQRKVKTSPPSPVSLWGTRNRCNLTRQKQGVHAMVGMKRRGKTGDNEDFINQCRSPILVYRAIVGTITNSTAEMSLKMPDCVNFSTRCHTEIIGSSCTLRDGICAVWGGRRWGVGGGCLFASGEINRRHMRYARFPINSTE